MRVKIVPRHRYICTDSKMDGAGSKIEDCANVKKSPGANEDSDVSGNGLIVDSYGSSVKESSSIEMNDLDAIDLSMKERERIDVSPGDKFKDTSLYRIMTDPEFLENIRKNQQTKMFNTCPFCNKMFGKEDELTDHLDIKKNSSNHVVCCACGKIFIHKRYLRYHQRCHSDRNKFVCSICMKKFSRLKYLTRHMSFHANPDQLSCSFCNRTFTRKDLLDRHQKSHKKKNLYYCDSCQKYFDKPLSLESHRKLVHSHI